MKRFLLSFYWAYKGIRQCWQAETNFRIHLVALVLVIITAILLKISYFEWLIIWTVSGLVISLELTNTAIEKLADYIQPHHDPQIGSIKDMMAGAVTVASIFAAIVGAMIFLPPLLELFGNSFSLPLFSSRENSPFSFFSWLTNLYWP